MIPMPVAAICKTFLTQRGSRSGTGLANFKAKSTAAFAGSATFRTASLGINLTPTNDFAFNVLARHHDDFPIAVPGLFPMPPTNVIGQQISPYYLGQPPYDVSGELRMRVFGHYYLDVSRTYYFNFGNLKWAPSFVIQVTQ